MAGLILNSRNRHPTEKIRLEEGVSMDGHSLPQQKELSKEQEAEYENSGGKFYTRPLIHFDMALFMAPMQMAGAVLGVLVQAILPNWLYLLSAFVVLSYTAYKTYLKYFSARKAEIAKRQAEEAKQSNNNSNDNNNSNGTDAKSQQESVSSSRVVVEDIHNGNDNDNGVEDGVVHNNNNSNSDDQQQSQQEKDAELRLQYLEYDARQYPKEKIGALVSLWIGLFLLTMMKGGKGVDSLVGIDCESPWFGVLIACQFTWLFAFAVFFGKKLLKDQQDRIKVNYPFLEEDPIWDGKSMRFYSFMCFMSGVVAGLIGIGGGMVLGPIMLMAGVNSRVSAATNSSVIVVTSSSVAVMFVTSGLLHYSYAMFYFLVCFSGAWIGKVKIDAYVKRTGRASILIFILASIIAFATVGCLVILLTRLVDSEWCFEDFNEFCTLDDEENCPVDRFLNAVTFHS